MQRKIFYDDTIDALIAQNILYDEKNQMLMIHYNIPVKIYNNGQALLKYESMYQQQKYNNYYIQRIDLVEKKIKLAYKKQFIEYQQVIKFDKIRTISRETIILVDEKGYYLFTDGTYICLARDDKRIEGLSGRCHVESYFHY